MADMNTPDNPPANHLGMLVRARRRALGLTQAELAARIEKSPSYISALESGSVAPSLMTLRHIAAALDRRPTPGPRCSSLATPSGRPVKILNEGSFISELV
jgi:transcriptional regulator with XRE-family HTH domain